MVWSKGELNGFVHNFSRQALAKKTTLSTVAECVGIARSYCERLSTIGLDLLFAMNGLLLKGIREAIQFNKDQLIEASRHRNVVCDIIHIGCYLFDSNKVVIYSSNKWQTV